jgi:nitrate/TMAO reductase-like tetraheme cytochrome c subunit
MFKKRIFSILFILSLIFLVTSDCFAQLPAANECNICHAVDVIYQEWLESKHYPTVTCYDCHIVCNQIGFLEPGEKMGFHILGYYEFDQSSGQIIAERLDFKKVCARCHVSAHQNNNGRINCRDCHMPIEGLTTYRVHSERPISFDGMNNNIKKYVTREHRIHTFKETYRPKHDQ